MKKLFLLLILSLFSAQSFAGLCPDGSEPIKSISEDGTYFVFNCGVSNEQSSSNSNDSSSSSSVKAVKFESFVDTETSSSCKDLDTNFYRKSPNKCSIIAVLDTKLKIEVGHWVKNVWQTSGLLINRVNKNGNLEIVGTAENIQVETNEKTDRPGQMEIATIEVNTEELGSNFVQVIKNPIVEIPASSLRHVMVDVNQDGVTELVIAGFLEDGRHQDSSWSDVNYIYNFETESYSKFGKPLYSHDFVAGDLDDDGYDEFIDISWNGGHGDDIGVCNGKTLECVYQSHTPNLHTSKTSLSVYPNKKGGILFHNCDREYLSWCWSEVTYKNGGVELKPLDKYIASKKPDKEELFNNWSGWEQKRKGWAVPGYETSERFKLISESYRSHQFDMDGDGDFDTATWKENRLCKKSASEKVYQINSDCKPVGEMFFFRNDNGKFTVTDSHDFEPGGTTRLYSFDINKDGNMDFYGFRDEYNTWECQTQFNNIFFGNGDGTFRRPSVEEQSEIFGNYGCEIQSYFFDFEGDSYRTFFTHKYSKDFSGSRAVYVGVERIASSQEKAEYIAEEEAKGAEEDLIEKELAEFEAELEAEAEDAEAKRKAKIAAAKAKRLAEEAAKAAEADTVDTEQSAEDDIAAFLAELAAELAEEAAKSAEADTVDTEQQSVEDEIAAFEAELEAELALESKATISPITEEAAQPSQSETSDSIDYIEKLKQIKSLLDAGIINEEDFEKMKQKIIDKM